jgi:L-malate glycosyltransferase
MFARDLIEGLSGQGGFEQSLVVLYPGPDEVGMQGIINGIEALPRTDSLRRVIALRNRFQELRPDIVFAHGGEPLKYAVFARAWNSTPKIVYRKIGLSDQWLGRHRWIKLPFQRWLLGRADAVAAVGQAMKQESVDLFRVAPDKIHVIYQGVDPSRFAMAPGTRERIRTSLDIDASAPVLLSVGALSWEKNQAAMLRILAQVRRDTPETRLLLVGDGPERAKLELQARDLGLSKAVHFLGTRSDVPELMAAADVLLLTSLTEGVPGVLIEAGMAGLPCVTWDVAGASEVVVNGKSGRVTPFLDEGIFASAVLVFLRKQAELKNIGLTEQAVFRMRFSLGRCVQEHAKLFQSLKQDGYRWQRF